MPFPSTPGFNFDDILNLLARQSSKSSPTGDYQGYQYFWGDHPEKDRTVQARYERFGGEADPLYGEIGRESSGYQTDSGQFPVGSKIGDAVNRLPIKYRQKYLHMLGQVRTPFEGNSGGGWQ